MPATKVICRLPGDSDRLMQFDRPTEVLTAYTPEAVIPVLTAAETAARKGCYVAGFVAYEAATAFEPACRVHPSGAFPLVWMAVFTAPPHPYAGVARDDSMTLPRPIPALAFPEYRRAVTTILDHIAAGDIYQANYTIRTRLATGAVAPEMVFAELYRRHPVPEAAYIDTGDLRILSLSPELFLERRGRSLRSVPMKGTAPRALSAAADRAAAAALAADEKNRAENLMIVDMVRNDLGRVCRPGSIAAEPLFQVETYRTVHQMIGTVTGDLRSGYGLPEIFAAAFPAASITGAPKIRAMEIIRATETSPRRAYTGSIGVMVPGGDCRFNVAIRTLIDDGDGYELGVGGGIVADSRPEAEWAEANLKSAFAAAPPLPPFQVIETIFYSRRKGWTMLEEHLLRAEASQRYFGRTFDRQRLMTYLAELDPSAAYARVRLALDADGIPTSTIFPLPQPGWNKTAITVGLAEPVRSRRDIFLYHKTTVRELYDQVYRQGLETGCDEMIWCNEEGELTEGCIGNLFLRCHGEWLTPAWECGLLPGIWRRRTLVELSARETILTREDLLSAETVLVGNSVRGGVTVGRIIG